MSARAVVAEGKHRPIDRDLYRFGGVFCGGAAVDVVLIELNSACAQYVEVMRFGLFCILLFVNGEDGVSK